MTEEDKAAAESITKEVTGELPEISVSDNTKLVVRTNELSEEKAAQLKTQLAGHFKVDEEKSIETSFISGSVSDEMKVDALVATLIATLCMLLYIWIRFRKLATASVRYWL